MRGMLGLIILFQFVLFFVVADSYAQAVFSEQQIQEKIVANKILHMYLTDVGITGFEINQYGAPSEEFLVPGRYEKIPERILLLAKEHNVLILPSQLSKKTEGRAWLPMVIWFFNVTVLLSILVTVIIINKRVSNIEKLIKK